MAATGTKKAEASIGVFTRARDTKNFVRYERVVDGKPSPQYVPNEVVAALGNPDSIEVVLRAV